MGGQKRARKKGKKEGWWTEWRNMRKEDESNGKSFILWGGGSMKGAPQDAADM